jgi:hydrogenase/urease accessory protein HupE
LVAFGVRVMPPLPLEVTHFITVVGMFYLEHGVCVGTYLPQNGFECAVQLGSPLLECILSGILAWFSVIFC